MERELIHKTDFTPNYCADGQKVYGRKKFHKTSFMSNLDNILGMFPNIVFYEDCKDNHMKLEIIQSKVYGPENQVVYEHKLISSGMNHKKEYFIYTDLNDKLLDTKLKKIDSFAVPRISINSYGDIISFLYKNLDGTIYHCLTKILNCITLDNYKWDAKCHMTHQVNEGSFDITVYCDILEYPIKFCL